MRLTYDAHVDAAYLELAPVAAGGVVRTQRVEEWLLLDFAADERLVGIEVLDARSHLPATVLDAAAAP